MSDRIDLNINSLLSKEIVRECLPSSQKVDSSTFSKVLEDMSASYKMYWLLGILEEVSEGKTEIESKRIIARMIAKAWYPIRQFRLSFGMSDVLYRSIDYIAEKSQYKANCDERKIVDFAYGCEDKELNKIMKELTYKVPYRLLAPFFKEEIKVKKQHEVERAIAELSLEDDRCLYKIVKGEKNKIILNEGWAEYLISNYKIIKAWIYYNLADFLQKRNSNVPAIVFKLEAPSNNSRNLLKATKLWKSVISERNIRDMYTGKEFVDINFEKYGSLSIDHFIPWSFVMHNELWNLIPTFKNIDSSKSDKLLSLDAYMKDFSSLQYEAFSYFCEKRMDNAWRTILM
ncbi:HNH endonuclease domain-containing protein [Clostridium sp. 19966]|uniref:HNH endonuclease domain-containing protein n=1 Tax=Clostridium sp. 19966 TaxID=2768166 RepID=UPI0028EED592|nr:HNH endonuclease domain-containing protein [Clostridium sp. 19966]